MVNQIFIIVLFAVFASILTNPKFTFHSKEKIEIPLHFSQKNFDVTIIDKSKKTKPTQNKTKTIEKEFCFGKELSKNGTIYDTKCENLTITKVPFKTVAYYNETGFDIENSQCYKENKKKVCIEKSRFKNLDKGSLIEVCTKSKLYVFRTYCTTYKSVEFNNHESPAICHRYLGRWEAEDSPDSGICKFFSFRGKIERTKQGQKPLEFKIDFTSREYIPKGLQISPYMLGVLNEIPKAPEGYEISKFINFEANCVRGVEMINLFS